MSSWRDRWQWQETGDWEDRVADKDEPLGPRDGEPWVRDAAQFVEFVAQCTAKPLIALAQRLPEMIEIEFARDDGRQGRRNWYHRWHGRRHASR
jgi:hypothetical protein